MFWTFREPQSSVLCSLMQCRRSETCRKVVFVIILCIEQMLLFHLPSSHSEKNSNSLTDWLLYIRTTPHIKKDVDTVCGENVTLALCVLAAVDHGQHKIFKQYLLQKLFLWDQTTHRLPFAPHVHQSALDTHDPVTGSLVSLLPHTVYPITWQVPLYQDHQ